MSNPCISHSSSKKLPYVVDSNKCRNTQQFKVQKTGICGLNRTSLLHFLPTVFKKPHKRTAWNYFYYWVLPVKWGMIGLLKAWAHGGCDCLDKTCIRSNQSILQQEWRETQKSWAPNWRFAGRWWMVKEGAFIFLRGVVPGRLTMFHWVAPHHLYMIITNWTQKVI